jgi:hypothetical protein
MSRYMRSRESGISWTGRIVIAVLAILILGAIGLGYYASTLKPPHVTYRQEIPSSRFPN